MIKAIVISFKFGKIPSFLTHKQLVRPNRFHSSRCFSKEYRRETGFHSFNSMILFIFFNQPTIFKASILLILPLIFQTPSSLQITHTNPHHNLSFTPIPHQIDHNPTSIAPSMPLNPQKKLQRLPHVFSQVLELPLRSQADVLIEDRPDCFNFTANVGDNAFGGRVRAYAVKIHPGVTKVVVRGGDGGDVELLLDKLEVDVWRFRLPAITRPELATAVVAGGKLVVTVPKGGRSGYGGGKRDVWGGGTGHLLSTR